MRRVGVLVLAGCGACPPLGDVPVKGADRLEAELRSEMAAIDEETIPDVCIDHVRVGDYRFGGRYNRVTHGIRLSPYADVETLLRNLRHEVCHGVDVQNDLLERGEDREAFAERCSLGGAGLTVLTELTVGACPDDPDLTASLEVRDGVYGGGAEPEAMFTPVAGAVLPDGSSVVRIGEGVDGVILVSVLLDGELRSLAFDPATGDPLPEKAAFLDDEVLVDHSVPPGWHRAGSGSAAGLDLVVGVLALPEGEVLRVLRVTGDAWAPTLGLCPVVSTRFFPFAGELWSAQVGEGGLAWGRWNAL